MTLEQSVADAKPDAAPAASGGSGAAPATPAVSEQPKPGSGAGEAPKPSTLLNGGSEGDDRPVAAPADWPMDWRDRLAGGDEKALKKLERYKSPRDVANALFAADQKIRSGELRKPLADEPTDEEVAEYRKANGIPDKPDSYKIEGLPKGFEFGDEDQPMLSSFLKAAHAGHMTPRDVNRVVGWYAASLKAQQAASEEADREYARSSEDALRAEWGGDYRRTTQALNNYIAAMPDDIGYMIAGARGPDGRKLGDHPAIIKWFADLALEANPGATFVAGDGSAKNMATRKAEIEQIMNTDIRRYHREKLDEEYAGILQREEQASRGRKA